MRWGIHFHSLHLFSSPVSFQHVFENDQGGGGGESMRRVIECTIHLIGANGIRTIVGKAKASTQAWAKREACISGIKWCEENGQSILSKLVEEKMAERGRLFASTPTK